MGTAITLGSKTSTGGEVISASSGSFIHGVGIACVGDKATCKCGSKNCKGIGEITATSPRPTELNGIQFAKANDLVNTGCGTCFLSSGSNTVQLANTSSSVFMGNGVYMGGVINIGLDTPDTRLKNESILSTKEIDTVTTQQKTIKNNLEIIKSFSQTIQQTINNSIKNGVYLWIETKGVGHTLISIFKDGKLTIYTYGRYSRKDTDGVLIVYKNQEALNYINRELYKMNASVYLIPDADEKSINNYFSSLWKNGSIVEDPRVNDEESKSRIRTYGRIIDNYDLTSSNCTTHAIDAINVEGSELFRKDKNFIIPNSLDEYMDHNYPHYNKTLSFELFFSKIYNEESKEYKEGGKEMVLSTSIEGVSFISWLFNI
ncbi:TPA: PAAR domain-containing protein [Photobacterium damselae]